MWTDLESRDSSGTSGAGGEAEQEEDRMQSNRHVRTFNQSSEFSLKNPFYVRFMLIKVKYFFINIYLLIYVDKNIQIIKKFKSTVI